MVQNTRILFSALLNATRADCICDVGSRDGEDALAFRGICPEAHIYAFEANPYNLQKMAADTRLHAARIEVVPVAVSDRAGTAVFHVTDADHASPDANLGTSSLLVHPGLPVKASVEVPTCRLDRLLAEKCPEARRIALWIDVEGAEYWVLEGASGLRERLVAIHVETSTQALREGQRTTDDLVRLLEGSGFMAVGRNFRDEDVWGDMVFIPRTLPEQLGGAYRACVRKARAMEKLHGTGESIRRRFPKLHAALRRWFVRL
jgi:FkbM family methyltransferase